MKHIFEIDGSTYEIDPSVDVAIDRTKLDEEFITIAAVYHKYYELEAMAESNKRLLETQLEMLYAQLDILARNEHAAAGVKVTEKMVENTVLTDKRYQQKVAELNNADKITRTLRAARDSMAVKRDALISLGAHDRQLNSNMRINNR